jgi:hypothetical protein
MSDWIDNLDKEQLENASLVAEEARKAGVPPQLAVAMAFGESALRHYAGKESSTYGDVKASPKGALGLMQLLPSTANDLNVDPLSREQNIRGGVQYLRQMLDKFDDPMLAAAAYNHGPSGSFFTGGNLPKETKQYLNFIKAHGGFDEKTISENAQSTGEAESEKWKPTVATGYGGVAEDVIAGAGALTGAAVSGTEAAGRSAIRAASRAAGEEIARQLIEAGKASVSSAVPEIAAAAQDLVPGRGAIADTPAGGKGTQNWGRAFGMADPEALRARSMKEANVMQQAAMAAEDKIKGLWGGAGGQYQMDPTRASLMIPSRENIPQRVPPVSKPNLLAEIAANNPAAISWMKRVLTGGLGGLGGALGGMQAVERYRQGDPIGSGLSGAGALGSLLMIPAATAGVGTPIAVGSGLALGSYDLARAVKENVGRGERWAKENPPTEKELREATRPYYGLLKQQ